MSSERHGTRAERQRVGAIDRRLDVGVVVVALASGGCFGDWVSARPRPRHDDVEITASPKLDTGAPADSCAAYVAEVAERCDAVLDGHLGHCHRELLRVMVLWHEGDAPLDHRSPPPKRASSREDGGRGGSPHPSGAAVVVGPRAETREGQAREGQAREAQAREAQAREGSCALHLRALPDPPRRAVASELGPECRAWAQALRERCVAPLSSIPPDLRGCGPDLLAFESFLGAITFGTPGDHEPKCRDAVQRLREGPSAPSRDVLEGAAEAASPG
jgi:hypothetical protein